MNEELAVRESTIELSITPVMDLATAKSRLAQFQEFVAGYMVPEEDFGIIPGTAKPTLLKPGADKLCEIYGLSDEFEIIAEYSREDWTMIPPLFDYTIRCTLRSKRTGALASTGLGSCNSYEGKYRWRDLKRTCPKCSQPTIIKGKEEYGGGYICWKKDGKSNGCGAKFAAGDEQIIGQAVGRTENDDIATLKNTILKMAKKRAKIDATLSATRSSGIFTQDLEDIGAPEGSHAAPPPNLAPEPKADAGKPESLKPPGRDAQDFLDEQAEAKATPPTTRKPTGATISEAQQKRLFAIATGAGWKKDEIKAAMLKEFRLEHSADILKVDYERIVQWFIDGGGR